MRAALLIFCVLAMVLNVLTTICSVVFMMACSPNSSEAQLLFIKRMMLAFGVVGLVCLIGAIVLSTNRLLGWSIGVSLFPVLFSIVSFTWLYLKEW